MELRNWALTLGLGAAVGAATVMMLPRDSKAVRMMRNAADNLEDAVGDAAYRIRKEMDF